MTEKDIIVLDIETKNTFQEVGQDNFDALEASLIGVYSYNRGEFIAFEESEFSDFGNLLKEVGLIIGFSITRFDLLVLKKYFLEIDLFTIPRIDILDEIEFSLGKRVGLDILAKTNLGFGKNGHSLDAAGLYRDNKMEELKNYCLNDVKITKDLYELAKRQKYLLIPQKHDKESINLPLDFSLL